MNLIKKLVLVASFFATQSVFANTYDNIDLGPPGSYSQLITHASNDAGSWFFQDTFNFTINAPATVVGDALDAMYVLKLGNNFATLGIDTFRVQLFSGNTQLFDLFNTPYDNTAIPLGDGNFSFNNLQAGSFKLVVTGQVVSPLAGGVYSVNLSTTPVPEPESLAMLLAGLGLLGFATRRKSTSV